MSNDPNESQVVVPPSFVALFVPPGSHKATLPREQIAARHELCEDMATMLVEPARNQLWDLGVTEEDVLCRVHRGLLGEDPVFSTDEARWIVCRLAEMLGWSIP